MPATIGRNFLVKKQLVRAVLERVACTPREATDTVELILEEMKLAVVKGYRVEIRGLGVFTRGRKRAGTARNVKKGTLVPIPPGSAVRFKVSKLLREAFEKDEV